MCQQWKTYSPEPRTINTIPLTYRTRRTGPCYSMAHSNSKRHHPLRQCRGCRRWARAPWPPQDPCDRGRCRWAPAPSTTNRLEKQHIRTDHRSMYIGEDQQHRREEDMWKDWGEKKKKESQRFNSLPCLSSFPLLWSRFHILAVPSSDAVNSTGSTGWNCMARIESKWERSVIFRDHLAARHEESSSWTQTGSSKSSQ